MGASLRPLGVMILALLRERDMHPYEMVRLLRERREDRLVSISNGTVYHQVGRLERDGLIAEIGVDREGNRPERTTYRLTKPGHAAVADWVRDRLGRTDRESDFAVALAEAHNLDRAQVIELLEQRRTALVENLDRHEVRYAAARAFDVDRQYLVELERAIALLRADLAWLATFIDDLRVDTLPWGAPSAAHLAGKERS